MPATPVQTAVAIIVGVGIVGIIAAIISSSIKFSGYEHIGIAARKIAKGLKASILRDGSDLLIDGVYQNLPTVVRFSMSLQKPALTILMRCHASFALSVTPAHEAIPGSQRTIMPTDDAPFEEKFIVSTDNSTMATLLLTRRAYAQIKKLACSNQTALNISPGEIELTESVIPATQTWEHIMLHVQSMKTLSDGLEIIPGAEKIIVPPYERDWHIPGRIAIAVGVLAAIMVVIGTSHAPPESSLIPGGQTRVPEGMIPNDAITIRNLDGWRLATPADFQADAMGWLRSSGYDGTGKIPGDFSGLGAGNDVAYVLVNEAHHFRVVLISNHVNRFDSEFNTLAAVARIPRNSVQSITWSGSAPHPITSDGLLIVRDAANRASAIALFPVENRVITGMPADYQAVSLR